MKKIHQSIKTAIQTHLFTLGIFTVLFIFVFSASGLVLANAQTLEPGDSHVVSLFIDNQEMLAPTRAATVGEFLDKMGVELREQDLVEPGIDTVIDADNFRVQVYRAKPVTIIDGATTVKLLSPHQSAKLIAEKAGFKFYPEDSLTLTIATDFIKDGIVGEKLVIDRATPVNLSLYGAPFATYRTHAITVGDFLKERHIVPETGATVQPSQSTAITPNLVITVSKYGKQVIAAEEEIEYEIQSTNDNSKPAGQVTVITPGTKGKKQVVYELDLKDGLEIGRRVLQEVRLIEPVTQVQTRGTKLADVTGDKITWMQAAGIAESDYYYVDFIVGHEGGWNGVQKWNYAGSGAYGICQALPAQKMASAGADYMTNPVTQLKWCSGYAIGRYGSWQAAYNFWCLHSWW